MTSPVQYSAFIAHAPEDQDKARQVEQSLTARGLRCWLSPAGQRDDAQTEQALNSSRCIVLLLSSAANQNEALKAQVAAGVAKAKPVFPVRIEEVLPSPELSLHVSSTGWIDAYSGRLVDHLDALCGELASGVTPAAQTTAAPTQSTGQPVAPAQPTGTSPRGSGGLKAAGFVVFALLLIGVGIGVWFVFLRGDNTPPPPPPPDEPYVDEQMPPEELLDRLLAAIDAEDYGAVRAYARRLFGDRRDVEIGDYTGRLQPPVVAAAREGNLDLFKALLEARPVMGLEDERGREPIHVAAGEGHAELIVFMVKEMRIDPDKPTDGTGFTPLHWAAQRGRPAVIDALLNNGADPQAATARGQTPLHIAVQDRQVTAIRALLKQDKTDVNAIDSNGRTALHLAAQQGNTLIVDLLLSARADTALRDLAGNTPGDLAYKGAHDDLADRLGR